MLLMVAPPQDFDPPQRGGSDRGVWGPGGDHRVFSSALLAGLISAGRIPAADLVFVPALAANSSGMGLIKILDFISVIRYSALRAAASCNSEIPNSLLVGSFQITKWLRDH